ncbi:MAG TPA: YkgJ family cysteine cluster protein [Phycisphaerae bacterium]|nr:YkgJ family cysteine cluster protein [Phycisphaerae bacterium]
MGSIHCEHCTGHCCRYVALPLEKPQTARDFDDIRWYLMHQGMTIFVEEGDWYIQFATTCKNLNPDNLCRIYETRPRICREYKSGECDYAGGTYEYDHLFTHVDQIEGYAREYLKKQRQRKRPSRNGRPKRLSAQRRTG